MPETNDPLSVPRRTLDIEDYIDITRRHRAWIFGPTLAGLVIGMVTAFLWPDTFESRGTIRISPPRVSPQMITQPIAEQMSQRMNAIYQTVTQRSNLLNLINTYNLYPEDSKKLTKEDVVEMMRQDIKMGRVQALSSLAPTANQNFAFSVIYTYPDRRLAYKVCLDMVSSFINESERTSSANLTQTTEFFKDQYDSAKKDLKEIERRITEFRTKNVGGSPEQEALLTARISALEQTVSNLNASMGRVNQDKMMLETELRSKQDSLQAALAPVIVDTQAAQQQERQKNDRLVQVEREIAQLEATLADLREKYRDDHPDVQRVDGMLKVRRVEREKILAESLANAGKPDMAAKPRMLAPRADTREIRTLQADINRIRSIIQAKDLEVEEGSRQLKESREKVRILNTQLDLSPAAQMQFADLLRERDHLQEAFEKMSDRVDVTRVANDLDSRKQGETLEILDPPFLPTEPKYPRRPIIVGAGVILGILTGLMLTGVREMKDTSLKNLKDVRAYTKLTVLASIPLLENDFVVRRRRRLTWLGWSAASILSILLMSGAVLYYYTSKN